MKQSQTFSMLSPNAYFPTFKCVVIYSTADLWIGLFNSDDRSLPMPFARTSLVAVQSLLENNKNSIKHLREKNSDLLTDIRLRHTQIHL